MNNAGILIVEFARQLGVAPHELGANIAGALRADGALPVPPSSDRSVWDPTHGVIDASTLVPLLDDAAAERGTPWPQPLASTAVRVHRDGDRDSWEQVTFARQRRVSRAAVAAAATRDPLWIDELADGIVLLCEQSSWCWPAHDDTFARHGAVLGTIDDPFLDLGAGEVAGQLAWIDHVLADLLDEHYPGLRARMALEVRTRVLEPFVRRRDWHWLGLDGDVHNWNPWIHGNVLVSTLRFTADAAERATIVALVIEGLDRYVDALPLDGAIDEGFGYWWNGACRALEALDILNYSTSGRLDATAVPALEATVAFPHRMHLGNDWYVNFADSQARPSGELPWHALHRAARAAHVDEAVAHAAAHRTPSNPVATPAEGLGRLLQGLTDSEWRDVTPVPSPLPANSWWPSTHVLVAREKAGTASGLTLAVKGGHNGENHNHNDVGSFIIASDGVPVVIDAGRPTYTKATFGPDRYAIWTMQSAWHNVPLIRGEVQSTGRQFGSRDLVVAIGDSASSLGLEIADAYDLPGLRSWHRTVTLEREGEPHVLIADSWALDSWNEPAPEPSTTLRFLLAGSVSLEAGSATITPRDGAAPVQLRWNPAADATITEKPLDDPMLSSVWGSELQRLDISVTTNNQFLVTATRISPTSEGRS